MTVQEYQDRRDSLVAQLASRQQVVEGSQSVTNRPIKDVLLALKALDNEWNQSQNTATARIGRIYFSGEGR